MLPTPSEWRIPLSSPRKGEGDSLGTRTPTLLPMDECPIWILKGELAPPIRSPAYLTYQSFQKNLRIQRNHTKHYIVTNVTNPHKNQKLNLQPSKSEKINKSNNRPTNHSRGHGSYRSMHRSLEIHGQIYIACGRYGRNRGSSSSVTRRPITVSDSIVTHSHIHQPVLTTTKLQTTKRSSNFSHLCCLRGGEGKREKKRNEIEVEVKVGGCGL